MSVQFYAARIGQHDYDVDIIDTAGEMSVSNANGIRIMRTLGLDYDPADQPAGEMTLRDMADAIRAARPDAVGHMVAYLAYLDEMIYEARDNGATVIAWA